MIDEERYKIINGDSLKVLDTFEDNYFDACITDPPYGLTTITKRFGKEGSAAAQFGKDGSFNRLSKGFMGKEWDGTGIEYNVEFWQKVYSKLKNGAYLLAFGGSRTFHRIACAIEDAGFEIRDTIMWLYGSGFPKSHNIALDIDKLNGCPDRGHRIAVANRHHPDGTLEPNGEQLEPYEAKTELAKNWNGWGTALKPAFEPIIVARKPIKGTVAKNCLKYGVGGLNIDECRISYNGETPNIGGRGKHTRGEGYGFKPMGDDASANELGRFPANVILTYDETDFEEVCGNMPETNGSQGQPFKATDYEEHETSTNFTRGDFKPYNDNGNACRYFYCAKASKKDRDNGLDLFEEKQTTDGCVRTNKETARKFGANSSLRKNIHPTVKPVELMQYLIRLVCPKGSKILDPFNGSGSTGKAVAFENRERERVFLCWH